jgi:hypothetical protein
MHKRREVVSNPCAVVISQHDPTYLLRLRLRECLAAFFTCGL